MSDPEPRELFGDPCPHGIYNSLEVDVIVTVCAKCLEEVREKAARFRPAEPGELL